MHAKVMWMSWLGACRSGALLIALGRPCCPCTCPATTDEALSNCTSSKSVGRKYFQGNASQSFLNFQCGIHLNFWSSGCVPGSSRLTSSAAPQQQISSTSWCDVGCVVVQLTSFHEIALCSAVSWRAAKKRQLKSYCRHECFIHFYTGVAPGGRGTLAPTSEDSGVGGTFSAGKNLWQYHRVVSPDNIMATLSLPFWKLWLHFWFQLSHLINTWRCVIEVTMSW